MSVVTIASLLAVGMLSGLVIGIALERARAAEELWTERERSADEIGYLRRMLGAAMEQLKGMGATTMAASEPKRCDCCNILLGDEEQSPCRRCKADKWPEDTRLRKAGLRILERRNGCEAIWERDGERLRHQEALQQVDALERLRLG